MVYVEVIQVVGSFVVYWIGDIEGVRFYYFGVWKPASPGELLDYRELDVFVVRILL